MTREKGSNEARMPQARNGPAPEQGGGRLKSPPAGRFVQHRPDKRTQELFIRGTGVRASTIWHDRYIARMTPHQIAQNRDLPAAAVLEALGYCQDHWDVIC